jgi:hypothetical protein
VSADELLREHFKTAGGTVVEHAIAGTGGGAAGAALGSRWKAHPTLGAAIGGGLGAGLGSAVGLAPIFAVADAVRGKHAGVDDLRKLAAEVVGRDALEERFGPPAISAVDAVLLEKSASADPELLAIAEGLGTGDPLKVYEGLGGSYSPKVRE